MPEVLLPEGVNKPTSPKTADDINDLFKTLDSEEEVKESAKKESKKDKEGLKEEPETEDEEIELKEPDEETEKLDLEKSDEDISIDAPPRKKEILKKYPDVFKDFPFLEKVLYRDKQYNELFGSFDDAKEIAERSEVFSQFESQLLEGNTENILRDLKESDSRAFDIVADNYLQTLAKVDRDAYHHVVGNLSKRLIMEMAQEAKKSGNDDLTQAAAIVNQFIFGTSEFTPPSNRVDSTKSPEKSEVEKERINLLTERFESARDELQTRVDNTLKATISEYIDQKGQMSSYVKKNAVSDAMRFLEDAISNDSSVAQNLNKLWRAATDSKYSKDSLGKIQSYYLGKARTLLGKAITKARAEALKDLSPKREKEDIEEVEEKQSSSRRLNPGKASLPKKNEMKKGETVADFFNRD